MEIQTMRNRLPGNVMRLCIDAGHAYDVSGRLYSRTTGTCLRFASMAELLLKTDALLDEIGSPQAFQRKRIFSTGKPKEMTGNPDHDRAAVRNGLRDRRADGKIRHL